MCLFFVKEVVSVRGLFPSPAWPLGCPRDKGMHPRGLPEEGRKEKERSSPSACHTAGRATCRDRVGSPRRCLRCVFSLNTGIWGSLAPGRWRLPAAPIPAALALGSCPQSRLTSRCARPKPVLERRRKTESVATSWRWKRNLKINPRGLKTRNRAGGRGGVFNSDAGCRDTDSSSWGRQGTRDSCRRGDLPGTSTTPGIPGAS